VRVLKWTQLRWVRWHDIHIYIQNFIKLPQTIRSWLKGEVTHRRRASWCHNLNEYTKYFSTLKLRREYFSETSEKNLPFVYLEHEGSTFLRNAVKHPPDYTASHPKRQTYDHHCEKLILHCFVNSICECVQLKGVEYTRAFSGWDRNICPTDNRMQTSTVLSLWPPDYYNTKLFTFALRNALLGYS
jgi:hypothetical protein